MNLDILVILMMAFGLFAILMFILFYIYAKKHYQEKHINDNIDILDEDEKESSYNEPLIEEIDVKEKTNPKEKDLPVQETKKEDTLKNNYKDELYESELEFMPKKKNK